MPEHKNLNIQNSNNITGSYPLFLGEDLGFGDTVNVTYPEIEEHYLDLRSMFWTETEFKLDQDRQDFKNASPEVSDVMILNLLSQWLMDSLASRSIVEVLGPFVTNNELQNLLIKWADTEAVHTRSYSLIIKQCFDDPNEVIERGKQSLDVAYRSQAISRVFQDTAAIGRQYQDGKITDLDEVRRHILRAVAALYALESVAFIASFACTFALCETGHYQGIGNHVIKIAEEELQHGAQGRTILDIMLTKEAETYGHLWEEVKGEIEGIFDEIIVQEFAFADFIFSDGRRALGLTSDMLKDEVRFLGSMMYTRTGFKWDSERFGEAPTEQPLKYMHKYLRPEDVQSAAQEIELTNYRVGQVEDDTTEDEFYFEV